MHLIYMHYGASPETHSDSMLHNLYGPDVHNGRPTFLFDAAAALSETSTRLGLDVHRHDIEHAIEQSSLGKLFAAILAGALN